jgi:hypothetical protein
MENFLTRGGVLKRLLRPATTIATVTTVMEAALATITVSRVPITTRMKER